MVRAGDPYPPAQHPKPQITPYRRFLLSESSAILAVHGHFYQPPREDPWTGEIPPEPGAEPYRNFNEKITAECYRPLAERCLFERISFNVGPTLIAWLARHDPETYRRILEADRANVARGVGNALAQSAHHTILPLARRRDKITQVYWGIKSFQHRFGRHPRGMWLPEMAVDLTTLEVLAEAGLTFTILSSEQVRGALTRGAGPYRVRLEANAYFTVFVRDRDLSNQVSFAMPSLGPADRWAKEALRGRSQLTLLAMDGETFGHHHREGVDFLERLLRPQTPGYEVVTLTEYLRAHPPVEEIEVIQNTAWSCAHGLARWSTGCACTPGDSRWKAILRAAMDLLSEEIDAAYLDLTHGRIGNPWRLRDEYIHVILGAMDARSLLREFADRPLSSEVEQRLLLALQAQVHRQRMFASCGWFFADLDGLEPRLVIRQAARAIELIQEATGINLADGFRRALALARSERTGKTGAQIFDEIWAARPGARSHATSG